MFRNVFLKSLFTLRWQLVGWSLGVMAIAFITLMLYPSFSQNGIENIVNSVPDSLKSLVGDVADFKTVPGYIGQQIFGPNLYIVSLVMTIIIFLSISASEEGDGRLQSLLSFPVSRTKVYLQKWLAATVVVAIICFTTFVAVWLALVLLDKTADYSRVLASTFDFCLLNLAYGMLAFTIGMFTGSRGLTLLLTSLYTVASFFITSLAPAVDKLKDVDKLSLLHYYNNPQVMTSGLNGKHVIVLAVVIIMLTIIGWLGFLFRDVRTN